MNRRQFSIGLAAAAAAPLVPALPAMAAAPATPAALGAVNMYYPWAVRYARVHHVSSPARLAEALKVPAEVAKGLQARMQAQGVLSGTGVGGLARAAKPISFDMQYYMGDTREALAKAAEKALEKADETLRDGLKEIATDETTDDDAQDSVEEALERPEQRDEQAGEDPNAEV